MRTFKDDWNQKDWEHACEFHKRYSDWLAKNPNTPMTGILKDRLADMEKKFPQLKKGF